MKNGIYMLCGGEGVFAQDLLNSFIITDDQGTVIVIDGGHAQNLPHFLKRLKEITGKEVSRVNAWILTHPHDDHIECFTELMKTQPDAVVVDKLYYNFQYTGEEFIKEMGGHSRVMFDMMRDFYVGLISFKGEIVIPELYDKFAVGEFNFEVLHTAKVPTGAFDCNNKSLVLKMSFRGKTVMLLADAGVPSGNKILETFPAEKLKSDICQMAHHGQCGVDKNLYEAISPEICLWNTPDYLWNNDLGKGYNTAFFKTVEVRKWMEDLGVKKNFVMKDGDSFIPLD